MSKLRKNLRGDKRLNAFNERFDLQYLFQEIEKAKIRDENSLDISVAIFTPFFSIIYSDFYKNANYLINSTNLIIDEIEEAMLANANRNFLLLGTLTEKSFLLQFRKDKGILFGHAEFAKVKSDLMGEDIYAGDAADNITDGLNMVFSYLQYKDREFDDNLLDIELPEPQTINHLMHIYINSTKLSAFKNTYDSMIWEDRHVVRVEGGYDIRFKDKNYAILSRANKIKIDQLSTAHAFTLIRQVKYNSKIRESLESVFRVRRKPFHIKEINVQNGYIIPTISEDFSSESMHYDISIYSSILTFYEYIIDTVLPNLKTLKIKDIIILYSESRELISKTHDMKFDISGYLTVENLYDYPFRISSDILYEYLSSKTHYSGDEINSFINLMTHKSGRINFWETPFLRRGEDLLFPILPIIGSNVLYITDEWLEAGGFSLDERGYIFEKYIKESIASLMDDKKFEYNIYNDNFIRYNEER